MTTREDGERTTGLWAPVSVALAPAWSVIDPAAVLVVFVLVGIGLILYAARRPARRSGRGEGVPPPFLGDGGDPGSPDGGGLDGGGLDGGGLDGGGSTPAAESVSTTTVAMWSRRTVRPGW